MKRLIFAGLVVAAISLVQTKQADAQIQFGFGGGSSCRSYGGYSQSYYRQSGYGSYYSRPSISRSYYQSRPTYHDTSHYDYHPTSIQRHRNHYHVVPGHYDLHRTGHWHH